MYKMKSTYQLRSTRDYIKAGKAFWDSQHFFNYVNYSTKSGDVYEALIYHSSNIKANENKNFMNDIKIVPDVNAKVIDLYMKNHAAYIKFITTIDVNDETVLRLFTAPLPTCYIIVRDIYVKTGVFSKKYKRVET